MLDIFWRLVNQIIPPHPSVRLISNTSREVFLSYYQPRYIRSIISLASYRQPLVKAAITANKFYNSKSATKLLALLLAKYLNTLPKEPTILIPIPLSPTRERARGYNQVIRVLTELPTNSFYTIAPVLIRTHDTKPQTALDRSERLLNMQDAFVLDPAHPLFPSTRYLIIDDVQTTGATLKAAKEALYPYLPTGSTLICLSLAH